MRALVVMVAGIACGQQPNCSGLEGLASGFMDKGPEAVVTLVGAFNNLAARAFEAGDYAEGEQCARSALMWSEAHLGSEHPDTGTSLNNLGLLLQAKGDFGGAEPLFRLAIAIRGRALGPEHPDTGMSLNNLAGTLHGKGDYEAAEPIYRRALTISGRALGSEHPDTAMIMNNLAGLLQAKGDYWGAEPLYRHALAISEKEMGPEHRYTGTSLQNLAELLRIKGDYEGAEPLYRRALAIRQKNLGPEHPDTGTILNNLGTLLQAKGDYGGAEPLYRRAITVRESALGFRHPLTGTSLGNLARLLQARGDYGQAEPLYRRALAIIAKALGPEHPETGTILSNLAGLLLDKGDYGEAEPLYRHALAISAKVLGPEHPETGTSLNNLAELLRAKGDYSGAELLHQNAFRIAQRNSIPELVQIFGYNLLRVRWMQGNLTRAEEILDPVVTHGNARLEKRMVGSENAARRLVANDYDIADLALSLTAANPGSAGLSRTAIRAATAAKGAVQEMEVEEAQKDRASGTVNKRQAVRGLQRRLQECWASKPECAGLEAALRGLTEADPKLPKVTLANEGQIREALGNGQALVEYVRYRDANPNLKANERKEWYAVYVVTRKGSVLLPRVAAASRVDTAVKRLHKAQSENVSKDHQTAAQALFELVWKPVAAHVAGYGTVFVAPDSELRLVNFYSLVDEQGKALLDKPTLLVGLTTGRDLVRVTRKRVPRQAREGRSVAIHHPAYLRDAVQSAEEPPRTLQELRAAVLSDQACPDLRENTNAEIRVVHSTLESLSKLDPKGLVELSAERATVEEFTKLQRPATIWLFTHGVFCQNRGVDEMEAVRIAMAGASGKLEKGAPLTTGWLTAKHIAKSDLLDTEVVATMTCVTARGTGTTNEGAYGVQRGLMLAGVRSSITMLWDVNVLATTELLKEVASKLGVKGKAEAYRDALRSVRAKTDWAHPYYWAASMFVGDPGPMRF